MTTFATLLGHRPYFRRLWLSELISLLGDWMSFVAVSLLALREGGGAVSLALVLAAHSLPHALLAPAAGVLADRLDRKRLLIAAKAGQGLLTLGMAGAAALGSVATVQILVFVRASAGAFLPPVQSAAMRRVVREDELLTANAISSATWSVMFAAGMAAGGALAALGPTVALLADAASFGVAAIILRGLPPMPASEEPSRGVALPLVTRDMAAAWRLAWSRPALLEAVLSKTPLAIAGGGAWVVLNLVSEEMAFAASAAMTLGILQCARGVGSGVGPAIASSLIRRGLPVRRAAELAAWTAFGGITLFALARQWQVLVAGALAWGMGLGANWVLSCAEIQRLSPDRFIGRLSAVDGLAWTAGMCLTALAGAAVTDWTGVSRASAWLGLAAGVAAWAGLRWVLRWRDAEGSRSLWTHDTLPAPAGGDR